MGVSAAAEARSRLIEAMTRAAGDRGYRGATVARVVAAAGASRATFYQHFRSRGDCFLAAYRAGLETVLRRCREATAARPGRPDAALRALFELADADPALARLLLVEANAGPRPIRREHQRLLDRAEQAAVAGRLCSPQLPRGALQGAIGAVATSALLRGDPTLAQLAPPLHAWVRSYDPPPDGPSWDAGAWQRLGREWAANQEADLAQPAASNLQAAPLLPRGRSALPAAAAGAERRERILEATCEVVARHGYDGATVAEVVAAARVTRAAFYSHFRGKEDAFLASLARSLQESVAAAAGEYFLGADWPERVWRGLGALLAYVAANPHAYQLRMVEVFAAGEAALRRAHENRLAFTLFLADGYRYSKREIALPALCSEAIAGAIEGILRRQLLAGEGGRALELLPRCAYVALAPFLGAEGAYEEVIARSGAAPPEARGASRPVGAPRAPAGSARLGVPG